jgi:hypothetical protein
VIHAVIFLLASVFTLSATTPKPPKSAGPLADWPRPQFKQGGAEAFLAYAVYGDLGELRVSSSRYRTNGLPQGVSARSGSGCSEFRSGSFAPFLAEENAALVKAVNAAKNCVVVMGSVPDPQDLNYLRDTIGVVTAMWDAGAVAIFDMQSFRWFSKSTWYSEIFEPAASVPRHHVSILLSEEGGRLWIHTRGMRKFGRPDISVKDVPAGHREAAIDLCNRFIEMMAFGAIVPEGQPIKMKTLPAGLRCHHAGNVDDPDFNNAHLEIRWPR